MSAWWMGKGSDAARCTISLLWRWATRESAVNMVVCRRDAWMNRVWLRVNGKRLRRDFALCVCCMYEQQTASRALGKGVGRASGSHTSVVHACQVLPSRCNSLITMVNCHKSQLRLVNLARTGLPHENRKWHNGETRKMMDFNGEKDAESDW